MASISSCSSSQSLESIESGLAPVFHEADRTRQQSRPQEDKTATLYRQTFVMGCVTQSVGAFAGGTAGLLLKGNPAAQNFAVALQGVIAAGMNARIAGGILRDKGHGALAQAAGSAALAATSISVSVLPAVADAVGYPALAESLRCGVASALISPYVREGLTEALKLAHLQTLDVDKDTDWRIKMTLLPHYGAELLCTTMAAYGLNYLLGDRASDYAKLAISSVFSGFAEGGVNVSEASIKKNTFGGGLKDIPKPEVNLASAGQAVKTAAFWGTSRIATQNLGGGGGGRQASMLANVTGHLGGPVKQLLTSLASVLGGTLAEVRKAAVNQAERGWARQTRFREDGEVYDMNDMEGRGAGSSGH
jgi:hypothetical protein